MTPEQWKQEFRNELDALREPIETPCTSIGDSFQVGGYYTTMLV